MEKRNRPSKCSELGTRFLLAPAIFRPRMMLRANLELLLEVPRLCYCEEAPRRSTVFSWRRTC
jgi:hypothetical protein